MEKDKRLTGVSAILWRNVSALMRERWGKVNLTRLGEEAGIGNGGATRLRDGASVGVDLVQRVAKFFKVDPWELLWPGFDPVKRITPPSDSEVRAWLDAYRDLTARQRGRVLDHANGYIEENADVSRASM